MTHDAAGPIILWEDYGYEGWKPKSYPTIQDALMDRNSTTYNFVITRLADFQIVERDNITIADRTEP